MWMNVTMKRKTPSRNLNYIKILYQNELHRLNNYMFEKGLTLSTENAVVIEYKDRDSFGCIPPSKLSWNYHLDYLLTTARKSLNFLNIVYQYIYFTT